ncbi:hypothetical protein EWM64_g9659 [Hericium alpestre]|uniref:Uncharacterized protein n=1 Tax=Hericium alpestre TaxID=135208 RepID=A0A4Y9ZIT0_9AGAM|nr:hypothetical protein EWM64_g9659 [Hericium alpestre]
MGCRPMEQPLISIELLPSSDPVDKLERLSSVLPLEDLRTLKIETDSDSAWPAETWIDIFGRCTRVEHLSVEGWNGMQLCKALTLPDDGAASADERALSAGQQLFFRDLKSLEVCTADLLCDLEGSGRPWISSLKSWLSIREDILNAGLGGSEDSSEDQSGEVGMDEDIDDDGSSSKVAEDRQGINQDIIAPSGDVVERVDNRLKRLWITNCSVMAKHVEQLKPAVQDLVWDRCEGIWEDASEDDHNYDI